LTDELKIPISVPGADKAKADLAAVAAAAQQATAAGSGGSPAQTTAAIEADTKAKTDNAEITDELKMKDKSLLKELASLSPEVNILAEAFNAVMTKAGPLAISLGLIGPVIGVATLLIEGYVKNCREQAAAAEASARANDKMADSYLAVEEAIDKTRTRQDTAKNPTSGILSRIRTTADKYGLSSEGVTQLGIAVAAGADAETTAASLAEQFGAKSSAQANVYASQRIDVFGGAASKRTSKTAYEYAAAREREAGQGQETAELLRKFTETNVAEVNRIWARGERYAAWTGDLDNNDPGQYLARTLQRYPELMETTLGPQAGSLAGKKLGDVVHINQNGTIYNGQFLDAAGSPHRGGQ
jgi:hypothetical protein